MSFSGSYSFSFGAGKGLQREISKSTRRCTAKDIYKLEWILKSAQKTRKVGVKNIMYYKKQIVIH